MRSGTAHATASRKPALREQDLTGRQKAAVLLVAIGPEASAALTAQLTPEEVEAISFEIAQLDRVPPEVVNAVLAEWHQTEEAAHSLAQGGVDYARDLLERTLGPQKAAVVLRRIEGQLRDSAGFQSLRRADPQQLAGVLRNEHPQSIALILAHLESALVADVCRLMEPSLGGDVLFRMARMEKVLPEVLQIVERSLGNDAALSLSPDMTAAGGPAAVAAVLNLVTGTLEKQLLDGIEQQDVDLVEQIKSLMFVFEDMIRLDDKALGRIMRDVETKELALALKAASTELKTRIRGTMTQRAIQALEQEIEFLGPVRLRDVETAQASIVKTVRALEEAGEIVLSAGGTDDVLL